MKKIILLIILIIALMSFTACNNNMVQDRLNILEVQLYSDAKETESKFNAIIDAIENKDSEALKFLFSKNALDEAGNNIENGIEYIFELYKGEIVSIDSWYSTEESLEDGEKLYVIKYNNIITTNEDVFRMFFIDNAVDTENPDNVGLFSLEIVKETEYDNHIFYETDVGIYYPD